MQLGFMATVDWRKLFVGGDDQLLKIFPLDSTNGSATVKPPPAVFEEDNGPWHIQHKPLVLRKWEPNLKELDFDLTCMPVWVQLHNVPLQLFTKKGLSYVSSAIGCIEIGVGFKVPKSIPVQLKDESIAVVKVNGHGHSSAEPTLGDGGRSVEVIAQAEVGYGIEMRYGSVEPTLGDGSISMLTVASGTKVASAGLEGLKESNLNKFPPLQVSQ
ncbi:hypothetical protein V6N13_028361 [Hibiscus sabdariffa]